MNTPFKYISTHCSLCLLVWKKIISENFFSGKRGELKSSLYWRRKCWNICIFKKATQQEVKGRERGGSELSIHQHGTSRSQGQVLQETKGLQEQTMQTMSGKANTPEQMHIDPDVPKTTNI